MIMTVCEDMVSNILIKILKVSYGHHGGMESHFQRQNQPTVNTSLRIRDLPTSRLLDKSSMLYRKVI